MFSATRRRAHFWRPLILSLILAALVVSGALPGVSVQAQAADPTIYVVQPGDTLSRIALRYGVAADELAQANGVLNPNQLYVGQKIVIPQTQAAPLAQRLHVVQAGETPFGIALKYDTPLPSLLSANHLTYPTFLVPGQTLIVPADAQSNATAVAQPATPLPAPFTQIEIGQLPLQQGDIMEVIVRTAQPISLTGQFRALPIPFAQDGDRYVALVPVGAHPVSGVMPGLYDVSVSAFGEHLPTTTVTSKVQIRPGHFNSEYIRLSSDRQQLLDPTLVTAELKKLSAVYNVFTPQRYWTGLFRVPVEKFIKISSPYGTRRSYDGGPFSSYHEGVDFAIAAGTPVYAPADGVVTLAEPLTVRGNAVIIDHGWGMYTGYWHLSEIKVTPGQSVKQGDLIALSGNTGLSTGAHLHWDLRVQGINVDALQLTRRVIP